MRILLAIFLSACFASSALASGGGGGSSSDSGPVNRFLTLFNLTSTEAEDRADAEAEMLEDPRVFTLPAVVAPLSVDGRLTGYAYVRVHVRAADGRNIWNMQERTHYALDAMVRAASRVSLSNADGSGLDRDLATQVWGHVLREYYGASSIAEIRVSGDDTRMLRR
ncbi:hypothetical protein [uncultured Maricaulis sp.]|uniref:hypothetical protein n=1 Tax=uncultured Maricaulis sp. TaxID=174710 RepID=UPI0030DDBD01|tara:strand:+ start:3924 stop:4421 length:498 start_codon:yes stop_codon:yes gene_type:complete